MDFNNELSAKQIEIIENEIKKVALDHLNAKDAPTALNNYTEDATIASNGFLYPSWQSFIDCIEAFYASLKEVNVAEWKEIKINVLNNGAATFNAKFRWSSTDVSGERTNLQGVWSALFIRDNGNWKIKMRHESFVPLEDENESLKNT